jgi:hypothetical protein
MLFNAFACRCGEIAGIDLQTDEIMIDTQRSAYDQVESVLTESPRIGAHRALCVRSLTFSTP